MFDEEKVRSIIDNNITLINDYLIYLSEEDIDIFYASMEELVLFYGYSIDAVRDIIESRTTSDVPTSKLIEIEGITNGMLFRLKYKIIPKTLKKEGLNVNRLTEI